jgi:hypothetical protein
LVDGSPVTTLKRRFDTDASLDAMVTDLVAGLSRRRSGERDASDREMELGLRVPAFVTHWVVAALRWADRCGLLPRRAIDGACAAGEACQIGLDLGCTCASEGLPCAISGFPLCGGACPSAGDCRSVSTPDGEGCLCQPAGSTCLDSSPTCGGTCPPGQTCTSSFGGLCLCG